MRNHDEYSGEAGSPLMYPRLFAGTGVPSHRELYAVDLYRASVEVLCPMVPSGFTMEVC